MATAPARRTAAPAARPAARAARPAAAAAPSSGYRGAEGRRMMEQEQERSAAQREAAMQNASMPFRFFCPAGETREYVIVDHEPDFFRFEHNLKNPRTDRWDIFCACISEHANCPVDRVAEREPYFAMYLTIIDLTPYVSDGGQGEEVPWSKKLLVVKPQQQKKFTRLFERHGTLRGMIMTATRDGKKDAGIGNDQEFVEFMEEEELLAYETQYTDKKDVVHDVIGHEPFDYDALFPQPTEQQLRALVGGKAEPGSRDDNRGSRDGGGDNWEEPASRAAPTRRPRPAAAEAPAPAARTRPAPTRRAAPEPEPEAEEEAPLEDEAAPPPRRVAPRASTAPARTAAPVRRAPARAEPEPAEEEAYEEEAPADPPQRSRAAPARGAPESLADRRRALRRQ